MDDIEGTETVGIMPAEMAARRKPGPRKKLFTRSEKISCRLTEEEKRQSEEYCKRHGLHEAKLLRASYLSAIAQSQHGRIEKVADYLIRLLCGENADESERAKLKLHIKDILVKVVLAAMAIFAAGILFSGSPTVAKYFQHFYENGKSYYMRPGETWVYHKGDDGWEVVPPGEKPSE